MKSDKQAFAVVRVDLFQSEDEYRFTVKEVVWTREEAEQEVERLNTVNADKRCVYRWQFTRVKDP